MFLRASVLVLGLWGIPALADEPPSEPVQPPEAAILELAARADALFDQGKWLEVRDVYQEMLGRLEKAGEVEETAKVLIVQANILALIGEDQKAEANLRRALGLLPSVDASEAKEIEARAREELGEIYLGWGRSEEGKLEFRKAQELWRRLGQPGWEFLCLLDMGNALRSSGELEAARGAADEADELRRRFPPEPEAEGDVLRLKGQIDLDLGRFQEALVGFYKAEDPYRQQGLSQKVLMIRVLIANVEASLGRDEQALAIYQKALAGSRIAEDSEIAQLGKLMTFVELIQEEKFKEAIELGLQVLPFWEKSSDRETEALVRNFLGIGYLGLGRWQDALTELTQADQISRDAKGANGAAVSPEQASLTLLQALAVVNGASGQDSRSPRGRLEESLALYKKYHEQVRALTGEGGFGNEFGVLGLRFLGRSAVLDREGALHEMAEMIDLLERRGQGLTLSDLRSSFSDSYSSIYSEAVRLNAFAGRHEVAFAYAEKARARAFVDQIGNQRVSAGRGSDPELAREERRLRLQLDRLRKGLRLERGKPLAEQRSDLIDNLQSTLEETENEYEGLRLRLEATNPRYAALVGLATLTLAEVQRQVLDDRSTLVEYFVPDSRVGPAGPSKATAWVVERDRFTMVPLPVSVGDLKNRIALFRHLIEARQPAEEHAAELYRDLFAPLAPHVRHRNLVIVPHGVLHFLPFAALWDGERHLGDAYTVSYAPSATALKFAREKTARAVKPILAVGNPDGTLPHAAREAEAVARLYRAKPLLESAATENALLARATQAGILHLAAHAELNPINPLFTSLRLAPGGEHDGDLEMHEVYGLDLSKTGLVVLSACETQMGKLTRGDEIEGLTRAFLYAGTPAVISSLWKVDSESTAFLMERFYRHLRKGAGRADALRHAQVETRKQFPHPYHWASFVLTGDGR